MAARPPKANLADIGRRAGPQVFAYDQRDVGLYALSVGAGARDLGLFGRGSEWRDARSADLLPGRHALSEPALCGPGAELPSGRGRREPARAPSAAGVRPVARVGGGDRYLGQGFAGDHADPGRGPCRRRGPGFRADCQLRAAGIGRIRGRSGARVGAEASTAGSSAGSPLVGADSRNPGDSLPTQRCRRSDPRRGGVRAQSWFRAARPAGARDPRLRGRCPRSRVLRRQPGAVDGDRGPVLRAGRAGRHADRRGMACR